MGVTRCVAVFGGSFDPVHNGHVALASYFAKLLVPDVLRIIPTGNPWQKTGLQATAAHRLDMVRLAFRGLAVPVEVDEQEIHRQTLTFTIDTLKALRAELGDDCSIAFLMGADQLRGLHTWVNWQKLFDLAHLCVASRPGFGISHPELDPEVAREFTRRAATPAQIRTTPSGLACIAENLAVDISATHIRNALQEAGSAETLLPDAVLDYIKQHHLYKN